MKTILLRITAAAVLVSGCAVWLCARRTNAEPQLGIDQPMCVSQIPSSWGEFKGGSEQSGFAFQDSAGTLRFVTNVPCGATPQIALEIQRTH
ncbi:MAG TPA: hypothetical protein VGP19_01540 [Candidatus Acidoferrales bacterium]|jgi:hypothetical protein|nr:hypothetical protein [Candidatus Acidoferrales bacterium]